jgi:2-iminobutanoate/2-iminopropanoate deaminase
MVSFTSLVTAALVASSTALALVTPKVAEQPVITYLGTQGPILCRLKHFYPYLRTD